MKTLSLSLRDIARIPGTDIRSRAFPSAHAASRETKMADEAATFHADLTGNLQMFSRNWTQPERSLATVKVKLRSV